MESCYNKDKSVFFNVQTVVNTSYLHEQTEDESSVVCGVLDVVVFFVGGEAIKP
jgi:hypothetical protein